MFKVAEHSFGSLWAYVICQIMARGRLQLTSWNLAGEKYTDERFWFFSRELKVEFYPVSVTSGVDLQINDFPTKNRKVNLLSVW